jgi:hypothetical protein
MLVLAILVLAVLLVAIGAWPWKRAKGRDAETLAPVAEIMRVYHQDFEAIEERMRSRIDALAYWRVNDPNDVLGDPTLIEDPERFERSALFVDEWRVAIEDRFAQLRIELRDAPVDEAIRNDLATWIDATSGRLAAWIATRTQLHKAQLTAATWLCRVVARGNWGVRNGRFDFTSEADAIEYAHAQVAWNDLVLQQRKLDEETEV